MNRLIRMTYGYGGTRLERTLVCGHHQEQPPAPLRLKLLLLAIWIVVPALVSLYAIPKTSLPMKTVIDISKLTIIPPPAVDKPVRPKPERKIPVEPSHPLPDATQEPVIRKPLERQMSAPPPVEVSRPSIVRPSTSNLPDLAESKPRVTRERRLVDTEIAATPTTRLRRETKAGETSSEKTTISRSRGATVMDEPAAKERIAVLRRVPSGDLPASAGGTPQRPVIRSGRSATSGEELAPRVAATRERTKYQGGGAVESSSPIGLARGVSLQSLEICSSHQLQEDGIKAILRVVGSRQSCSNEKGEFHFKGTQRISSFNLMIYPSPGRKPSNRCEELENAYKCLKTH